MKPILCRWTRDGMQPAGPYWLREADRQWVIGERYAVCADAGRSRKSHDHFFASVSEAWRNLPDDLAARFPTPEHLRKAALIATGYRDERSIVASSRAEALRIAAFVRPLDEYAVVSTAGATVLVLTARSQSMRAMGQTEFQASKDAVLDYIAALIGVPAHQLQGAAMGER